MSNLLKCVSDYILAKELLKMNLLVPPFVIQFAGYAIYMFKCKDYRKPINDIISLFSIKSYLMRLRELFYFNREVINEKIRYIR